MHYVSGEEAVSELAQKLESPVIMFTTRWCPYCHQAREYFKRHSITYTEYDIEVSKENSAKFRALGGTGVPLIIVGNKRMDGFTPRSFNDLLNRPRGGRTGKSARVRSSTSTCSSSEASFTSPTTQ